MNLIPKVAVIRSLSVAILFLLATAPVTYAQKGGPLNEILQRLDAFVVELDSLDQQTETLENPSLEDKILDALSIKICGKLNGKGALQGKVKPIKGEVEGGVGIGPNVMGTGVELKIEPKVEGDVHFIVKAQASVNSSICVSVYDLAEIIKTELDPPDVAGAIINATDPALLPLENFARNLSEDAKEQILAFAEFSPGDLLELIVLVLKDAGIDPTVDPSNLANGMLATVDAIQDTAMDLSPQTVLDFAQSNSIIQNIPLAKNFKMTFEEAIGSFAKFNLADVNPCTNATGLPDGLSDILSEVCGITGIAKILAAGLAAALDSLEDAVDQAENAVASLTGAANTVKTRIDNLFGDVNGALNGVKTKICKTYSESAGGGALGVRCDASVSFNPCNVAEIKLSFGCSGP